MSLYCQSRGCPRRTPTQYDDYCVWCREVARSVET